MAKGIDKASRVLNITIVWFSHLFSEGIIDTNLCIKKADTTVEFDREIKMPLYAKSGVREVWLVDLNQNAIAVYREPSLSGYGKVQELRRGQMLTVQAFSDVSLAVDEVLG